MILTGNLKNKNEPDVFTLNSVNYFNIPEGLYTIDKNNISYLFKKSDEYAIALILHEIRVSKYMITKQIDDTFQSYISKLIDTKLYFENLKI